MGRHDQEQYDYLVNDLDDLLNHYLDRGFDAELFAQACEEVATAIREYLEEVDGEVKDMPEWADRILKIH